MRSIPTLFEREKQGKRFLAVPRFNPDAMWLLEDNSAVATEKFDGTACWVTGHKLYKRLKLKPDRGTPDGWVHWRVQAGEPEPADSGHGWMPVGFGPEDHMHREVLGLVPSLDDGTWELVGLGIGKNPHGLAGYDLWKHGSNKLMIERVPTDPELAHAMLGELLRNMRPVEGIVWHGVGGMVKLKRRDFGIPWPAR